MMPKRNMAPKHSKKKAPEIPLPPVHDWRTTDEDEINKRRVRGRMESFVIANTDCRHPIFSNFRVKSKSGLTYSVEIRDLARKQVACECVDFRTNGLGTCKHVEAVLALLEARHRRLFRTAEEEGSSRIDVIPDVMGNVLHVERGWERLPRSLQSLFPKKNGAANGELAENILAQLEKSRLPALRISQEVYPWLEARRHAEERKQLRRDYERKVHAGEWPANETKVPLYPYQREGMLHLAFTERALLADEMGLGKTIQAIAACALLHRLGKVAHALVVTPASLKTEWEDQIQRFTSLPYQLIFGPRHQRLKAYANAPFFTIVNYEQMLKDALDVNSRLRPDVVILDEAQRIKNWNTQTAQAVKRLRSRYAFVLTGTPIENRIDELHSIMGFLDPSALGPLFRFNREYYELDDRGKPSGFRNLAQLHERIKPFMLRRRKADVETELPERTDKNFFVPLSGEQQNTYGDHEYQVSRLVNTAKRRPLTQQEQDKLMRELAMMRMICDTNYILDQNDKVCPKLGELEKILEECCEDRDVKVIIFSEWERMLVLVRELCEKLALGFAWHTGSVPQRRRRAEILMFKNDPRCRVFLSTDSGSTGLNLQNASVVINCDLPWNPAKLEQRIARAWRKHQTRAVTVINLVSEKTIEQRMLETLASKQALADGILDRKGDLDKIKLAGGRQVFLKKLEQIMAPTTAVTPAAPVPRMLPVDRSLAFSQRAREIVDGALVRCEERYPSNEPHSVLLVVVDRDAPLWMERLVPLHQELFGAGRIDPLAPVMLEVIDRATDEALQRLSKNGLVTLTSRATRPLFSKETPADEPVALTEEERNKIATHRQAAARKLKMVQLLGDGDLAEETQAPLSAAILDLSRALAIKNRLTEPQQLKDVLQFPGGCGWQDAMPIISRFVTNPASACWKETATAAQKTLATITD
jgi:hypothetical protein